VLVGLAVTVVVLGFFAADTLQNSPETFSAMIGIAALAVAIDFIWKRMRPSEPAAAVASEPTLPP